MRSANVYSHNVHAGILHETDDGGYIFEYLPDYTDAPVSLSMPIETKRYEFDNFPPFFEGLLPEGIQLEGLLIKHKIDKDDYFTQLVTVGGDLVGAVTVEEIK